MSSVASRAQLAHVTESLMRAPLGDPSMERFLFVYDAVARTARTSAGFVWQLESEGRGHPVACADEPRRVVSVSVWENYAALHAFVHRSSHGQTLLHRQSWFEQVPQPSTALWWVQPNSYPSVAQALARLDHLRRLGPTPQAFTLTRRFDHLGRPEQRAGTKRRTYL